jgi:hypothetical protein
VARLVRDALGKRDEPLFVFCENCSNGVAFREAPEAKRSTVTSLAALLLITDCGKDAELL